MPNDDTPKSNPSIVFLRNPQLPPRKTVPNKHKVVIPRGTIPWPKANKPEDDTNA